MTYPNFLNVCLCSYDSGATTTYLYEFGSSGAWSTGISTACSNERTYGVVACAADKLELAAPPAVPSPPALPPSPPSSPPPAICHASCPQSLTMVTPLSESSRHLSNATSDASLNDCNRLPGWYHFPGTRMAIRDIDGEPPQGRCGAGDGMMSMMYGSEIPQPGADKSALTLCALLPVPDQRKGQI